MPKKRKLNSKNPKYMDKVEEVKATKKLIAEVKGVRIYAVFNE
jgi:hypothetical protein|tara:strand:- start:3558 stop:3686 length:129 start_codon:yes stop_codon:yes gene_type:complete